MKDLAPSYQADILTHLVGYYDPCLKMWLNTLKSSAKCDPLNFESEAVSANQFFAAKVR